MSDTTPDKNDEVIHFILDGVGVTALPGETIWQATQRYSETIPHLCFKPNSDYRADGNCRVCMVEIEGERTLAASCIREPVPGMVVRSQNSERAKQARKMVMELLMADQPEQTHAPDRSAHFWQLADELTIHTSRLPAREAQIPADNSHPAMSVNLQACINCVLCVTACREVQVNDVIGMANRNIESKVVFDFDDPMEASTCVGCGECVQACPTGALMPSTLVNDQGAGDHSAIESKVDSVCPYCGVGCQLTYNVRDNQIIYVEGRDGPSNQSRLCVKGRFGFDYVKHPDRLTQPLIRRPGIAKGLDPDFDPANPLTHFYTASWPEAISLAANGLLQIRDMYGDRALAGFGSAKCSNEEAYLFQKLVRTGFRNNNVDHCTRLCHASSVTALLEGIGSGAVSASFMQAEKADVIILAGCNPAVNHPVAATYFKQAAKRGAKLIILDPRGLVMRDLASYMVQFTPGADVALFNAMMHVIVEEKLYNQAYIDNYTESFSNLKNHVSAYSPEKMAVVCGVPAEQIREIARTYAKAERAMIFWGMGISQHVHGTDNSRCLISLALMCGQIGRPGTGLHPLRGQNNVQGASDSGLIPMFFPDYQPVGREDVRMMFEALWQTELDEQPGLTVVEIIDAIHNSEIHGMYIMGENPAMSDPDLDHSRAALAKLQHLVVQDLFVTETAQFADIVLPASGWPEKDGTVTNSNRQIQMGRQALRLPGEAKPDWWIIQQVAQKMGLPWHYEHPRDVFAEMKLVMPSLNNISWQRLEQEDSVTYPCDEESHPGTDVVFSEGFPRPSGKAKFIPADIIPPDERPDDSYPLILTTGRQLEHWHTGSMTRRSQVLDDLEPEAVASINPNDLKRQGVVAGEQIAVLTRRGRIELMAREDQLVPEGVVFIAFCFAEAAANLLTNAALDPYAKIPEFKYCACRLERRNSTKGEK